MPAVKCQPNTPLKSAGRIVQLWTYPIKGLRGLSLQRSVVEPCGLALDRRWMLVDSGGLFISQRTTPELARFSVSVADHGLYVDSANRDPLFVPSLPVGAPREVTIWGTCVQAVQVSESVDRWFSDALGRPCSLVAKADDVMRPVNRAYGREGDQVAFSDGFPILAVNAASLDDLNSRLDAPAPVNRFRGNVLVEGPLAWAEDAWREVRLGAGSFRAVKPCGRCLVTTTDQETGERGVEPLRTLARIHTIDQAAVFGMYLIPNGPGSLRVGDGLSVA